MKKIMALISLVMVVLLVSSCQKQAVNQPSNQQDKVANQNDKETTEVVNIESDINAVDNIDIGLDDNEISQLESDLDI